MIEGKVARDMHNGFLLCIIVTAAGCHSPVAVSGSDGNAFAEKSIETVTSNTLSEKCPTSVGYFLCRIPSCNYRTSVL